MRYAFHAHISSCQTREQTALGLIVLYYKVFDTKHFIRFLTDGSLGEGIDVVIHDFRQSGS